MSAKNAGKSCEKKRRVVFSDEEIHTLLGIWSCEKIQGLFKSSIRHNLVWNLIAEKHRSKGYFKTGAEVKSKINNLKTEYRIIKPKSGSATPTWPYFEVIHKVLCQRDCVNDHLLDDSMRTTQVTAEDVESCISDNDQINERISTDNTGYNSANECGEVLVDDRGETHLNNTIPQGDINTSNCTHSCGKPIQQQMRKIARPPRRKGSDESQLIKTLIESEKRYSQRLLAIEEQEKRAQERQDSLAQSMNRFLNAFAILAEKSMNSETTLPNLTRTSGLHFSNVPTSGHSLNTSSLNLRPSMNDEISNLSHLPGMKSKQIKKLSVPTNLHDGNVNNQITLSKKLPTVISDEPFCKSIVTHQTTRNSVLTQRSIDRNTANNDNEINPENEIFDSYDHLPDHDAVTRTKNENSQSHEFHYDTENCKTVIEDSDDEKLPPVPWLQPDEPKKDVRNVSQNPDVNITQREMGENLASNCVNRKPDSSELFAARAIDTENMHSAKRIIVHHPIKTFVQPTKLRAPLPNSQPLQVIHTTNATSTNNAAEYSPINVLNNKKDIATKKKDRLIYITLSKNE